jgi:hypothetical protein
LIRNSSNLTSSHEALAAELTNHLVADAVLTPGAVAALLYFRRRIRYAT